MRMRGTRGRAPLKGEVEIWKVFHWYHRSGPKGGPINQVGWFCFGESPSRQKSKMATGLLHQPPRSTTGTLVCSLFKGAYYSQLCDLRGILGKVGSQQGPRCGSDYLYLILKANQPMEDPHAPHRLRTVRAPNKSRRTLFGLAEWSQTSDPPPSFFLGQEGGCFHLGAPRVRSLQPRVPILVETWEPLPRRLYGSVFF